MLVTFSLRPSSSILAPHIIGANFTREGFPFTRRSSQATQPATVKRLSFYVMHFSSSHASGSISLKKFVCFSLQIPLAVSCSSQAGVVENGDDGDTFPSVNHFLRSGDLTKGKQVSYAFTFRAYLYVCVYVCEWNEEGIHALSLWDVMVLVLLVCRILIKNEATWSDGEPRASFN